MSKEIDYQLGLARALKYVGHYMNLSNEEYNIFLDLIFDEESELDKL